MAKKSKLKTPDWILEGYNSEEEYNKKKGIKKDKSGKTFKIKLCPKCGSDKVNVLLTGEEGNGKGEWECKKCKWFGKNVKEKTLGEDNLMKYLDERGEEVG